MSSRSSLLSTCSGDPQAQQKRIIVEHATIEDVATAKRKLTEAGFDPNDCITAIDPLKTPQTVTGFWYSITPMTHFSFHGDLPMCRYILSQGGATTKVGDEIWYPLWAATNQGHLAVCQWLYKNGAKEDATAKTSVSISPLSLCWSLSNEKCWEIGEWFLANGAIHNDHSGEIDPSAWSELIRGGKQKQKRLLSCSQNVLKNRDTFQVFLMGTCVCPEFSLEALATKLETKLGSKNAAKTVLDLGVDSGKAKLLWTQLLETRKKSPVAKISGQVGVLKCIAEFVGVSAKELDIHHRLVEFLTTIDAEETKKSPNR